MANYFKHFNKVFYDQHEDSPSVDVLTNLTTKISFMNQYSDNTSLYYYYSIEDGETPEILAYKLYGSVEKHWILLMFNNILDPQYDWPMEQRNLGAYIENKYSTSDYADTANTSTTGLSWAMSHTKDYFVTEETNVVGTDYKYSDTYVIDSGVYANTSTVSQTITLYSGDVLLIDTSKYTQSYYEYEIELNESKRNIKILKPEFVAPVYKEFKSLVK